jgi:aerobic carbon-monoxide dehydrogenase large subunit
VVPTILYATLLAGQYTTPAIYCEVTAVFTNTAPVDAYRGAGRPEATYLVERIVETAARELGIDPAEMRRRNFITSSPTPRRWADLRHRRLRSHARPRHRAGRRGRLRRRARPASRPRACCAAWATAPTSRPAASRPRIAGALGARAGLFEAGEVRVHPTGKVTVFTGSHSHGQGHETTFAQVVADRWASRWRTSDRARRHRQGALRHGHLRQPLAGVGGTAIVKAVDKVIAKGKKIAAHLMEAADTDIVFENGEFKVAGTDKKVPFAQVALTAYVPHNFPHDKLEPGLNENAFYDPSNFTYPGRHLHLRGGGRPGHRRGAHRPLHRGATTSATSSTR